MFDNDAEIVSQALMMWANYIQTGYVGLNRNDLIEQGRQKEIKALTLGQEQIVQKLQTMSMNALTSDIQLSSKEEPESVSSLRKLPTPKPRSGGIVF